MRRPLLFLAFVFVFATLPATVSAQKGGAKGQCVGGGMSGPPGMMMKGPPGMMGPPRMMAGPPAMMMPGFPMVPQQNLPNVPNQNVPLQNVPLNNPLQEKQLAFQKNIAVMKILVPQLRANKIDVPAAKALAQDMQKAIQAYGATGTVHERETKLVSVMNQTLLDLRDLANEPTLSTAHQAAMARIVAEYEQALETAQKLVK